jgi:hypothetical protein
MLAQPKGTLQVVLNFSKSNEQKNKMRQLFLIGYLLLLIDISIYGQTYSGASTDKNYNCLLRINKDSTINFIYDRSNNGIYGEHIGAIKQIDDTLFHISATMTIGQFYMKSFDNDTIYIQLDSCIATQLDKIEVEYSNGTTRKQFQGYNNVGKPIGILKIPVDKKLYSRNKGTDFITITINRKNFLTDKFLTFKIPFGSAASFTCNYKLDFDIVIKGEQLWTVGQAPLQTGKFKLKRKNG